MEFLPGQRWINSAELELGLGTVTDIEYRTITLMFPASGQIRTYAKESSPLTRVQFAAGDHVIRNDGEAFQVQSVTEDTGLFTYHCIGEDARAIPVPEQELNHFIQLNRPTERLFNGQIDSNKLFELRSSALEHRNRLAQSELRGLTGGRTSIIQHQLYIAHEVAHRYAPRVLLADEVGLGKTIEAGLILHQQLLTERAHRALIVVPESLLHQWLVEMLRRFNLHFRIFDEERCQAFDESETDGNPFESEQLALCTLEFLSANSDRVQQCADASWDMFIVDEAHHLAWAENNPSLEYQIVEQLSRAASGVLLLTATPEQLGKESHFARLRLLDPQRFHSYDRFIEEEAHYQPVAEQVEALLAAGSDDVSTKEEIDTLLDRHGTGRVLFRNTRSAVQGFPERQITAYPLPAPPGYSEITGGDDPLQWRCSPECTYRAYTASTADWTEIDPRIAWMRGKLTELRPNKVLVIASSAQTAIELSTALRAQYGVHTAVFHEGLTLVERDRAAAFFADREFGTQVLICSEIGSEGRNFQFAHELILFDLPINPDLLEQRIGRLDRIGQTSTIHIHVPYLEDTAQATMYHWYHRGLQAFTHTCPIGHAIFTQFESELSTLLDPTRQNGSEHIESLITRTQSASNELLDTLHHGRDKLLEYNSCRPQEAARLQALADEQDGFELLSDFMDSAFECYGIDSEFHSEHCLIIKPGEHMVSAFPGLPEDGLTVTYSRDIALANEDMQFLSWDHPITNTAIDMAVSNELGNTALIAVNYPNAPKGSLLLECIYLIEAAPSDELHTSRYLPPTTVRVVLDGQGQDHADVLSGISINKRLAIVPAEVAVQVIKAKHTSLRDRVNQSEIVAQDKLIPIIRHAHQQAEMLLNNEIDRLNALQSVNPNVRQEEIDYFTKQLALLNEAVDDARLQLDAVRVLVAT